MRKRTIIIIRSYITSYMNIQFLGPHTDETALCDNAFV